MANRLCIVVLVAAYLVLLAHVPPAAACTYPPCEGLTLGLWPGRVDGVRADGTLVFPGSWCWPDAATAPDPAVQAAEVTLRLVRDDGSAPVEGTWTFDRDLFAAVWKPASPLEVGAHYQGHVLPVDFDVGMWAGLPDGGQPPNLHFTVEDGTHAPPAPVTDLQLTATEVENRFTDCCAPPGANCQVDTCGITQCSPWLCWRRYEYRTRLAASWSAPAGGSPFTRVRVRVTSGDELLGEEFRGSQLDGEVAVTVRDPRENYCVTVETLAAWDGSRVSATPVCIPASSVTTVPRHPDETPRTAECAVPADAGVAPADAGEGTPDTPQQQQGFLPTCSHAAETPPFALVAVVAMARRVRRGKRTRAA